MELDDLKLLFEQASFIRAFENQIAQASEKGMTPGLVHLSNGAEVADVVLRRHLNSDTDKITGSHRSHSLALIGGVDPVALAAEIMGRSGGVAGGLGGTQHIISKDTLFLTSNGIVGAQVPIALGAALSAKQLSIQDQPSGLAVAVFGEGASNQGGVFESMNMASALHLPILFLMQNNQMAQSTSVKDITVANLAARARSFGMVSEQVDGADVMALETVFKRLTGYIRETRCPVFLEVSVPRLAGHYHGDQSEQNQDIIDPIDNLEKLLLAQDMNEGDISTIRDEALAKAISAIETAQRFKDESAEHMQRYIAEHPQLMGVI
jgi:pyruvate dehydrogenase E1 component alpha subunit